MDSPAWKPLGELLVEQSLITPADLEQALEEQERTGRKLGQIVVEGGFVSVDDLTTVLLEQCGIDMSTEDGFGSGLRGELAKRGNSWGRERDREREPVRFAITPESDPEQSEKKQKKPKQENSKPPSRAPRSRRVRLGRNPNRKPLKRLEKLVADFERQERELVETITSLRQMLRPVGD